MVTGGNGFIGSNLIKRLLNEGYKVSSLDNLSTGLKEYEIKGCHYHYGDIEQINLMEYPDVEQDDYVDKSDVILFNKSELVVAKKIMNDLLN